MMTHAATQAGHDRSRRSERVARPGPAQRAAPPEVPKVGEPWRWEAFDVAPFPVHILTEQGLILEANAAFEELFGAPRGQFVGRHQAVLNNASVAVNLRLWRQICSETANGGLWRGALRNRRCDGSEFTALAHVYPMRAAGRRYLVCFQEVLGDARSLRLNQLEAVSG
ncbi:MAG TPA: PAS domain-containing protein [Candidatus Methanoperedens sp.]|nr:PAS domain-containing protein [Candidatus Methanoperedens sp.]